MNNEAFLSTAAQVIPVLLLVLFVDESRHRRAYLPGRWEAMTYLTVLLALGMGEFVALTADPDAGSLETARYFVTCAIVAGFIALIGPLLGPAFQRLGPWPSLLATIYLLVASVLVIVQAVSMPVMAFITFGLLVASSYWFDPYYRTFLRRRPEELEDPDTTTES